MVWNLRTSDIISFFIDNMEANVTLSVLANDALTVYDLRNDAGLDQGEFQANTFTTRALKAAENQILLKYVNIHNALQNFKWPTGKIL